MSYSYIMIEIGYNSLKKDLNKIRKFKNPTLDIDKNRIKINSNYKTFLNKNQYNNLIQNGNIKYKLADVKKRMNIQLGDGIASLIQMALPFVKSVAPKILGTLGISSLGAITSSAINKKMNKDHIIKISDKQLDDINKNLEKINKMNVFDKKNTLNQKGSGIFTFLLPMLASTIIPALIPKKGKGVYSKNIFFTEIKNKYPELFKKISYPLSNIFINNLLKEEKSYLGTFLKDEIPLIQNNKSLIFNLQNSNQAGSHWISLSRKNNNIFIFDSFGIGHIPKNIYEMYKNFNIITNIYRIQHIISNLCGLFHRTFEFI